MRLKTIPIFIAFFVMGFADAMGPMSDAVKNDYKISNVAATLLSFFVFIAFAAFSVPGGLLATRIGKKKLLLLGLGLNAVAVLIPTLHSPTFPVLLGCIFMLGVGITFLQVAGNPIMRDVSAEGGYSRNLSFAQGIKGLGSTASTYMVTSAAFVALFQGMGWRGSFPIFFAFMALGFVTVAFLRIEETTPDTPPSIGSSLGLLKDPVFFMAVLGIFLYVGAEASMGRFLKPILHDIGLDEATVSKFGPAMFFLLLTIGRLVGGVVLTVLSPRVFFRLSALLGLLGAAAIMTGSSKAAIAGVVMAGLGFANIWPLLFSITVEEKPERASELSGLMCMAISGGAIVPLVMGKLVDLDYKASAFVVPAICFAYLLAISLRGGRAVQKG
jgi:MFS transporter, FHS family, L-fucose permease